MVTHNLFTRIGELRERKRKIQERNVANNGNENEKQPPAHFQPPQQQPQQFQQTQYHHMKPEKSVNVSQNQSQNQSQNPIQVITQSHSQSHSQSQSQSQSQLMSKSHAQSPSHSRNQPYGATQSHSGVKIRPSRAFDRSMSNMTKNNSTLSSSLIGYDDKAGSPLLEKKMSQANAKSRPAYVGKTEGDVPHDQSGFKQSSVSPQRVPVGRKTYYMGGSHVAVKNILRTTSTGMNATSKVLSTSGNSFILKKK